MKVARALLSKLSLFRVDGDIGKCAVEPDLRNQSSRQIFESLSQNADVIINGYCPGSLAHIGYCHTQILKLIQPRNTGIIYISESCVGALPPSSNKAPDSKAPKWSQRPGWQQIAKCETGIARTQGTEFPDLGEPAILPLPTGDWLRRRDCGVDRSV